MFYGIPSIMNPLFNRTVSLLWLSSVEQYMCVFNVFTAFNTKMYFPMTHLFSESADPYDTQAPMTGCFSVSKNIGTLVFSLHFGECTYIKIGTRTSRFYHNVKDVLETIHPIW